MFRFFYCLLIFFAVLSDLPVHAEEGVAIASPALNDDPSFENMRSWNIPPWLNPKNTLQPIMDNQVSAAGKQSVRFDLQPGKQLFYWQSFNIHPGVKTYHFAGWIKQSAVRGTQPGIRLELVSKGTDGKEKFHYFPAIPTGKKHGEFAEYAGNAQIMPHAIAVRLELFAPSGSPRAAGRVWFDAVTLTPGVVADGCIKLSQVRTGGDHGIYVSGAPQRVTATVVNGSKEHRVIETTFRIRDFRQDILREYRHTVNVPALNAVPVTAAIDPTLQECGFYTVEAIAKTANQPESRVLGALVVTEPMKQRDPFFGFTGYGAPDTMLECMAKLGAGSCGYIVHVTDQNPRGVFNFERHTTALKLRRDLGYKIIAGYNIQGSDHVRPAWLNAIAKRDLGSENPTYSEEYFEAYRNFARAFGTYARDKVDEFSLIEEIDIARHLSKFEHDSYIRITRDSAAELRKTAPGKPISGVGVCSEDFNGNPPLADMKHFWSQLSNSLDAIGFDGYITPNCFGSGRIAATPESARYREKLLEVAKLTRQANKRYFAMEEAGWGMVSGTPLDSGEWLKLAAVLQRTLILSKTVPEMERYLYFKVINGGRAEDWNLFVDGGAVPTAAAAAFGVAAHNLAFARNPSPIFLHENLHCWLFDQDGKTLVTLWSTADAEVLFKMISMMPMNVSNFMGLRSELPPGEIRLRLSGEPLYLWSSMPRAELEKTIQKACFTLPELKLEAFRSGAREATVSILNLTDVQLELKLQCGTEKRVFSTAAHQVLSVKLPNVECDADELRVEATTGNGVYTLKKSLAATPVGTAANSMAMKLDDASHLQPVDALANGLWSGADDLSVEVSLHYDAQNLYLRATVRDDVKVRERSGIRLWGSDSIQFAINPNGDALPATFSMRPGYGPRDWEFGMALTPEGPQLYCYRSPKDSVLQPGLVTPDRISFAVVDCDPNTTCYEVALPWAILGMQGQPGTIFGFGLIALDSDRPGQTSTYAMGLAQGIFNGKNPSLFHKFILK